MKFINFYLFCEVLQISNYKFYIIYLKSVLILKFLDNILKIIIVFEVLFFLEVLFSYHNFVFEKDLSKLKENVYIKNLEFNHVRLLHIPNNTSPLVEDTKIGMLIFSKSPFFYSQMFQSHVC